MSVNIRIDKEAREVVVTISEQFDLTVHDEFGKALDATKDNSDYKYIIDMGPVSDMDSSALGMLLMLRDMVGEKSQKINIIHCQPDIKDILQVANFQNYFNIS